MQQQLNRFLDTLQQFADALTEYVALKTITEKRLTQIFYLNQEKVRQKAEQKESNSESP